MPNEKGLHERKKLSLEEFEKLKGEPPMIDIFGDVNSDMFVSVRASLMYLRTQGNPEVHVHISSPGGDESCGLDIYDLLRLYPGKKVATVFDKAASMAAIILQACDVRQCAKHSGILIHNILRNNITLDILRDKHRLEKLIAEMERRQKKQYEIFKKSTGKTIPAIRKACSKNQFMDSEEALSFGLIDRIV